MICGGKEATIVLPLPNDSPAPRCLHPCCEGKRGAHTCRSAEQVAILVLLVLGRNLQGGGSVTMRACGMSGRVQKKGSSH